MMQREAAVLHSPTGAALATLPAWSLVAGQCWAILGANGSGKSSLLREMGGRDAPLTHTPWRWAGQPLPVWHDRAWARQRASLGQRQFLTAGIGVRAVIEMGAFPWGGVARVARQVIDEVIATWDVEPLLARRWPELSGGEQQRVQLARSHLQLRLADAGQPRLWLLDEPLAALDWPHQQQVAAACRAAAAAGAIVVVSVHDVNAALAMADHSLVLSTSSVHVGEIGTLAWQEAVGAAFSARFAEVPHPAGGRPWLVPLR